MKKVSRLNPITKRSVEESIKEIRIQLRNLEGIRFTSSEMNLFKDSYQLTIDCMQDNITSLLDCTTEEYYVEMTDEEGGN